MGTVIALLVNYPNLADQGKRISENAGDAVSVVILVLLPEYFMGLFQETGMAEALAVSFTKIIPNQLAGFWGMVIAIISAPGTFFISMMAFITAYFPFLAEAGEIIRFLRICN